MGVDEYLGRVRAIAWEAAKYVSSERLAEVHDLIDHDEPAEGMCSLAWAIVAERNPVPRSLIGDILAHAADIVPAESMPDNLWDFANDEIGNHHDA